MSQPEEEPGGTLRRRPRAWLALALTGLGILLLGGLLAWPAGPFAGLLQPPPGPGPAPSATDHRFTPEVLERLQQARDQVAEALLPLLEGREGVAGRPPPSSPEHAATRAGELDAPTYHLRVRALLDALRSWDAARPAATPWRPEERRDLEQVLAWLAHSLADLAHRRGASAGARANAAALEAWAAEVLWDPAYEASEAGKLVLGLVVTHLPIEGSWVALARVEGLAAGGDRLTPELGGVALRVQLVAGVFPVPEAGRLASNRRYHLARGFELTRSQPPAGAPPPAAFLRGFLRAARADPAGLREYDDESLGEMLAWARGLRGEPRRRLRRALAREPRLLAAPAPGSPLAARGAWVEGLAALRELVGKVGP